MPRYDFICDNKHEFEIKLSYEDSLVAVCPDCGASAKAKLQPTPIKLAWIVPLHNKDPFNPHPQGYTPGNLRGI